MKFKKIKIKKLKNNNNKKLNKKMNEDEFGLEFQREIAKWKFEKKREKLKIK